MRAVMPGYVNYFYKDGKLPTHTKSGFRQHGVLTVHGIITKNVLIFMHKLNNFPNLLPPSVRETIGANAPIRRVCSDHETCKDWLEIFGTHIFNKSIAYKGPLLYVDSVWDKIMTPSALLSMKAFKRNVKRVLLELQGRGDAVEWQADNFLIYNISGLRKSARINLVLRKP